MVARLLHNLVNADPDEHFAILQAAAGHLAMGGPRRTRHTTPALIFCTLQLMRRLISLTAAGTATAAAPATAATGAAAAGAATAAPAAAVATEGDEVAAVAAGVEALAVAEPAAAATATSAETQVGE